MNRVVSGLLILSLSINVYLYRESAKWEEAWLAQFLTTADVEELIRFTKPDLSFEDALKFVSSKSSVSVDPEKISGDSEYREIRYDGTTFYFKDDLYIGSKADLPAR